MFCVVKGLNQNVKIILTLQNTKVETGHFKANYPVLSIKFKATNTDLEGLYFPCKLSGMDNGN
jgi:hypothetical protein